MQSKKRKLISFFMLQTPRCCILLRFHKPIRIDIFLNIPIKHTFDKNTHIFASNIHLSASRKSRTVRNRKENGSFTSKTFVFFLSLSPSFYILFLFFQSAFTSQYILWSLQNHSLSLSLLVSDAHTHARTHIQT